jgi:hypothetical protein
MPPKGQRHPGYGLVFFPALQQDTTQLVVGAGASAVLFTDAGSGTETFTGTGASAVLFTDAGSGKETFTGTGASAVRFTDAGSGKETFTGTGASAVPFTDAGVGFTLVPIIGSGASLVVFVDAGAGNVAGNTVFAGGGGGGGFKWNSKRPPEPRKKKKKRALPVIEYRGADETPARLRATVDPVVLDRALFATLPDTGRIAHPARQQARAQVQAQIEWHEAHDIDGFGASGITLRSGGRGEVVPAEMMSMMRLLVEFQEN